jgi:beta-glucosidase
MLISKIHWPAADAFVARQSFGCYIVSFDWSPGDRRDLRLPAADTAIIAKAHAAGVPVITLLYSGRPIVLDSTLADSTAFVAAWLPGTEGLGLTDVLFGDAQFHGKLPRTWPRSNVPKDESQFSYGFGLRY